MKTASGTGATLLRCMSCPMAYCLDCFPSEPESQLKRLLARAPPPDDFVKSFSEKGYLVRRIAAQWKYHIFVVFLILCFCFV